MAVPEDGAEWEPRAGRAFRACSAWPGLTGGGHSGAQHKWMHMGQLVNCSWAVQTGPNFRPPLFYCLNRQAGKARTCVRIGPVSLQRGKAATGPARRPWGP